MATHAWFAIGIVTVPLVSCGAFGCSSGGGGNTGGDGGESSGSSGGNGTGPCAQNDKAACDACIADASKKCDADLCKSEDGALQDCSTMAVYYPCEDPATGATTIDCCQLEQRLLLDCWGRCPEMQACS